MVCKGNPKKERGKNILNLGSVALTTKCEFGIREIRYANYRVAVSLLVGQGWEQRLSTLPK